MDIEKLFKPIETLDFKENYFKSKSLYIEGDNDKFSDIFRWEDLNNLLDNAILPDKNIRIIKSSSYKKCRSINDITKAINDGHSLIFNKLHKKCKKIGLITEQISFFFKEPAQVNLYMSPPSINGFNLHYDTHDVIVLQIYGNKHWDIYSPTVKNPVFVMKHHGKDKPKYEPYMSKTLTQGDLLYVPRGHWHFPVATGNEPSLHLTFGIKSRTGLDFIKWLEGELTDSDLWREEFTFNEENHFEIIRNNLIKVLNSKSCFDNYKEYCSMNLWALEEINFPKSFAYSDVHSIRSSTVYIRNSAVVILKISKNNIQLLFNNKIITLNSKTEKLINYLISRKKLNLANLSNYNFDLYDDQIYKISEVLFLEGILSIE